MYRFLFVVIFLAGALLIESTPAAVAPLPTPVDSAIARARILHLAEDPQWLALGHYRKSLWGGWKSEFGGRRFFLAPEGQSNPQEELEADLRGFASQERFTKQAPHPRCRFPARWGWLREKLPELSFFQPHFCPIYEAYRTTVSTQSVSVVFSSYYLNNPSSAFGHTFLRLGRHAPGRDDERLELLDMGVNYAAAVTTQNPLLYAFDGIFGLFNGEITRLPYYYKVREYNDAESRDLWQYELNLTAAERERLVEHLWEAAYAQAPYLYLTRNCSYEVMALLEAAAPDKRLVERLGVIVFPASTVRILAGTPGLVRAIRYRPSLRRVFDERVQELGTQERSALKEAIGRESATGPRLALLDRPAQARVLDAALDYVDFRHFRELIRPGKDSSAAKTKQSLLVARSRLGIPSPDLAQVIHESEMPHTGHGPGLVGVATGASEREGALLALSYRLALHDRLDPAGGFPESAQIEFLRARASWLVALRRLRVDELTLVDVVSAEPWREFAMPLSWHLRAGGETARDNACAGCFQGIFEVGGGLTLRPWRAVSLLTTLDATASFAPVYARFIAPGVGPTASLRIAFSSRFTALLEGRYRFLWGALANRTWRASLAWRWGIRDDVALESRVEQQPLGLIGSAGALWYF